MEFEATDLRGRALRRDVSFLDGNFPDISSHLAGVLISEHEIKEGIERLANALAQDYQTRGIDSLVVLYVPRGAKQINDELLRNLIETYGFSIDPDVIKTSRYTGDLQGGEAKIEQEPAISLEGRHVLIIEDLVDEGYTGKKVIEYTLDHGAASVRLVSLARKPSNIKVDLAVKDKGRIADHYAIFDIDPHWGVGFGMDATLIVDGQEQNAYRDLPFIAVQSPDYLVEHGLLTAQKGDALRKLIHYDT